MLDPLSNASGKSALYQAGALQDDQTLQSIKEQREITKACRMFESYFLHLMLKEMRNTVPESGLIKVGQGEKIFRDLLDQAVADESVKSRSVGLADMMEEQLSRSNLVNSPSQYLSSGRQHELNPPSQLGVERRTVSGGGFIRGAVPKLPAAYASQQSSAAGQSQAAADENGSSQAGSAQALADAASATQSGTGMNGLASPLEDYRVTSLFGMRVHPISGRYTHHNGLDMAAPTGAEITSAADGEVVEAGWVGGYGNLVEILHPDGTSTLYGHCRELKVTPGQTVTQGEVIATVGSTGRSTGPHLHFEVRDEMGRPRNPQTMVAALQVEKKS